MALHVKMRMQDFVDSDQMYESNILASDLPSCKYSIVRQTSQWTAMRPHAMMPGGRSL